MQKGIGNIHHIKVPVELDLYNAAKFKGEVLGSINGSRSPVLFDCVDLEYLDSSGLGVFISVYTRLEKSGGKLCFINAGKDIRKIIALTGLSGVLPFEDTLDDAMDYFAGRKD